MNNTIEIEPSDETPQVTLNSKDGIIKLTGRSMPAYADTFYEPILNWLKDYVQHPAPYTAVECFIDFYNTRSSKCIFQIMRELEQIYHTGNKLSVKWVYEQGDTESLEFAEMIETDLKLVIQKESVDDH